MTVLSLAMNTFVCSVISHLEKETVGYARLGLEVRHGRNDLKSGCGLLRLCSLNVT